MSSRRAPTTTVWVLGDQLSFESSSMADARPDTHRVLLVESRAKIEQKRWHVQRAHLIVTAMRRFADDCRARGFEVDHRVAASLRAGFHAHVRAYAPEHVVAMDRRNLADIERLRRISAFGPVVGGTAKLSLLRRFSDPKASGRDADVPDPVRGGPEHYETAYRIIEAGCLALLEQVLRDE